MNTLPRLFYAQAQSLGPKTFLKVKQDGQYQDISWAQAQTEVKGVAAGLLQLLIQPGDCVHSPIQSASTV